MHIYVPPSTNVSGFNLPYIFITHLSFSSPTQEILYWQCTFPDKTQKMSTLDLFQPPRPAGCFSLGYHFSSHGYHKKITTKLGEPLKTNKPPWKNPRIKTDPPLGWISGHQPAACLPEAWREETPAHGSCGPTPWSPGASVVPPYFPVDRR